MAEPEIVGRRDLFQFNVLTVTSASQYEFADRTFKFIAAFSLVPFIISCIILLFGSENRPLFAAKISTALGFLYIALALGLLVAFA
jgi:hypothetical protein